MNGVKGILLMAGMGARFGQETPKQFQPLAGKKVYRWALETMLSSGLFDEILLVSPPGWKDEIDQVRIIEGGNTRQESSYLGLLACGPETDIVLIHDGARPFVSERILRENVEKAKMFGATNTCIPSADTLVYAPEGTHISEIPKRAHYLRGQTPQTFSYPLLLEAHEKGKGGNATDDCQLILAMGKEVHIVPGNENNLKITSPRDLQIAEGLIKRKQPC